MPQTLVGVLSRKTWLTMLLRVWALYTTRVRLEACALELERVKEKLGKRQSSIWNMNKAELVEVARKELGMSLMQAEKETVMALRERIRSAREVANMESDPLARLPQGLDGMKKEHLRAEILVRGLPEPERCTRPKMIALIRDSVAARQVLSQPTQQNSSSSTTDPKASTKDRTKTGQDDGDWEMPDAQKTKKSK